MLPRPIQRLSKCPSSRSHRSGGPVPGGPVPPPGAGPDDGLGMGMLVGIVVLLAVGAGVLAFFLLHNRGHHAAATTTVIVKGEAGPRRQRARLVGRAPPGSDRGSPPVCDIDAAQRRFRRPHPDGSRPRSRRDGSRREPARKPERRGEDPRDAHDLERRRDAGLPDLHRGDLAGDDHRDLARCHDAACGGNDFPTASTSTATRRRDDDDARSAHHRDRPECHGRRCSGRRASLGPRRVPRQPGLRPGHEHPRHDRGREPCLGRVGRPRAHTSRSTPRPGRARTRPTVPDVTGRTIPQAVSALQHAGLRLIFLKKPVTDRSLAGTVVEQTPAPGAKAPKNAQVLVYMGAYSS